MSLDWINVLFPDNCKNFLLCYNLKLFKYKVQFKNRIYLFTWYLIRQSLSAVKPISFIKKNMSN